MLKYIYLKNAMSCSEKINFHLITSERAEVGVDGIIYYFYLLQNFACVKWRGKLLSTEVNFYFKYVLIFIEIIFVYIA